MKRRSSETMTLAKATRHEVEEMQLVRSAAYSPHLMPASLDSKPSREMKIFKPDKAASKITPHPDFSAMCDERLNLNQNSIQEEIDSADDPLEKAHLETRMQLLQAERRQRAGPKTAPCTTIVLQDFALYGLAGDIVKTILPYTEAHPAALLIHTLVSVGNLIGHNAHFRVEHTLHYLNLFAVLVGVTSRSRKGMSGSTPGYICQQVNSEWHKLRIKSGLSSGQGLIWAVRDPITESRQTEEGEYEDRVVDPGEDDKRLLVIEQEFSQALKSMPLEGNILSAVIREAWDSGNLNTLTSGRKLKPVTATDAHISILGHITQEELLRHLNATEQCNGFANRFLWLSIERSKRIPNPKGTPDSLLEPLIDRLRDAVAFASKRARSSATTTPRRSGAHATPN